MFYKDIDKRLDLAEYANELGINIFEGTRINQHMKGIHLKNATLDELEDAIDRLRDSGGSIYLHNIMELK